jgi:hypothetical protein
VVAGPPTGEFAAPLAPAALNWVPVAAPADVTAAVLQAFSALPAEHQRSRQLIDALYMTDEDMADPAWSRGALTRAQVELVAMTVSRARECFY